MKQLIVPILLFLFCKPTTSQSIFLDEKIEDWQAVPVRFEDAGDNNTLDIRELSIANDDANLYFKLCLEEEILIQQNNLLTLTIEGIDYRLDFVFGERRGTYRQNNFSQDVFQDQIGLISSPTVSSRNFEIKISRTWDLFNQNLKLEGNIKIRISNSIPNGDSVPNLGNVDYEINEVTRIDPPSYQLHKSDSLDFRLCSYNVLRDGIFESDKRDAYSNILKTINADIYCFQEIYDNNASQLLSRLQNSLRVLDADKSWFASKRGFDNIIVTHYPIIYEEQIAGNGFFVLDIKGKEIAILNLHLPCCEKDQERENEIDILLSYIRNSKAGFTSYLIKEDTPIIICGDMNFVGNSDQVAALESGNIFNNNSAGPDVELDSDGDGLRSTISFATGQNSLYTWNSTFSSFSPGRLDYIFYSNSNLELRNTYSLDTRFIAANELNEFGLERSHTALASDHLPLVADYVFNNGVSTIEHDFIEWNVYPNPTSNELNIEVNEDFISSVILNLEGQIIFSSKNKQLDLSHLNPGIYWIKLSLTNKDLFKQIIIY